MATTRIFPFTAIVGQQRMMRALVLNAVDNRIGGVLIRGERGTGKSTAARAFAALLPDIPRERIRFIGNSSLAGARLALLSCQARRRTQEIAASVTALELTVEPAYFDEYTAALFLPHTDLSLFPSLNA